MASTHRPSEIRKPTVTPPRAGAGLIVHPPGPQVTVGAKDRGGTCPALSPELYAALVAAPALPTVYPIGADVLCGYAEALAAEQFPALEILARPLTDVLPTLREVFALPARKMVYWGIGTLKNRADALAAAELRPDFFVSPAFSRRVLEVAVDRGIPYIPGVYTFQDVQDVLDAFDEFGLSVQLLKLCPVYGLTAEYVRSLAACFPGIAFCPTGEINLENYEQWKRMPAIVAPMGSRLIPRELLERNDFTAVRQRLQELRKLALSKD
ncbi:MAG: bifunctional 4-hydroxy-2-oxoglutarate aldolase/2-dehydro-3-deoxy-phosphogluconate aldolase [Pirellulales bacterium]